MALDFGLDKAAALARERALILAGKELPDPRPASLDPRYPFKVYGLFDLDTFRVSPAPRGEDPDPRD